MSDMLEYFRGNFLLSSLSEGELTRLLGEAHAREFSPGETLLQEGDEGNSMLLINRGEIEVRRGSRLLATLQSSTIIGEMALLDPAPRSASVIALSTGTLYEFHREALWNLVRQGDSAAIKTLQKLSTLMCQRLTKVNDLVQDEMVSPKESVFQRLWKKITRRKGKENPS